MMNEDDAARGIAAQRRNPIDGLASQLEIILDAFRFSGERAQLRWLGAGLVVVISLTAFGQIRLNAWNQPFYDALARKDLPGLGEQLLVFVGVAGALLVLNVAQMWLSQMSKLKLREALTRDLFSQWLTPRRARHLAHAGEIGVNPDQRIHADAQRLAEVSTDLGVGLLQATMLLVSFVGVLWALSAGVRFHVFGFEMAVPGYMVWCALLYASVAWYASWRVGGPLVRLGAERYARESELRFALMHVNEHGETIAICRGERAAEQRLRREFARVLRVLRRLANGTTTLTWVTAGYGWFTIIAPIIVASPAYFAGTLTFGGLLMAVGAFTQVQQSLRWFVDNTVVIADWRATLFRVASFRQALRGFDEIEDKAGGVDVVTTAESRLVLKNLVVATPSGRISLDAKRIEIVPGDHVLIVGEPRSGKTLLFHTLAGVRRSGAGEIRLPPETDIVFMPRRPYVPALALRDVLAYPETSANYSDADFVAALDRMGLRRLATRLDRVTRWDRELIESDQQALAFARLLLRRPRFVIVDEAIDSLTAAARVALFDVFAHELAGAALVSISGPRSRDNFYSRVYRLSQVAGDRVAKETSGALPAIAGKVAARSDL